ncbi:MAG: 50S ribosomal protein L30 [Gammaproteobacteria bacterium]|nr:50S ribosomal protein L30 [Gammaproteobacteria bacterium]
MAKQVKITLTKSTIGRLAAHKSCVSGLGLRRIHQTIIVDDTPCNRGMMNAVSYMLKIEDA